MYKILLILSLILSSCANKNYTTKYNKLSNNDAKYYKIIALHNLKSDKKSRNCYGNNLAGFFYLENFNYKIKEFNQSEIKQISYNIFLLATQYKQSLGKLINAFHLSEYEKIDMLLKKLLATFNHDIFEPDKFIINEEHAKKLFKARLEMLEEIDNLLFRLPLFEPIINAAIVIDYNNIVKNYYNQGNYLKSSISKVFASGYGRIKLYKIASNKFNIEIKHNNNLSSFYENLSELYVKDNELVQANQIIANADQGLNEENIIYYYIKYNNKFIKPNIFMFHHFNCE